MFRHIPCVGLVCLALSFATPAHGQTWTNDMFASDAAWNAFWGGNGSALESFGAEGRFANNSATGDWEYGINRNNPPFAFGVVTGQRTWPNNSPVAFTLTYAGSVTRVIEWTVGTSPTLSTTASVNFPWIELLDIRVRANSNTIVRMDNLVLNGVAAPAGTRALADGTATAPNPAVNYLRVEALDLSNGFTLTGDILFDWGTSSPSGSQLSFQIKAMQAVPEPTTLALLGSAGLGAWWWRHRRYQQQRAARETILEPVE